MNVEEIEVIETSTAVKLVTFVVLHLRRTDDCLGQVFFFVCFFNETNGVVRTFP